MVDMKPELLQNRGEARPLLFVQMAVLIASSADGLAELLRMLIGRKRAPRRLPPVSPLSEWLPHFQRHSRLADAMVRSQMSGLGASWIAAECKCGEVYRLGCVAGSLVACG